MDDARLFCEIVLALDGFATLFFSVQYLIARELYNNFTTALKNGINSVNTTELHPDHPKYAVVRGQVRALAPLIKSLTRPSESGVIQNLTIKEHASRRFDGMWENQRNILDSKYNIIPFELKDKNFRVIVTSPSESTYLKLPVIDDKFEPADASIIGFLFGIHRKGYQYTECLLRENDLLTGFGEIIVGNDQKLLLVPPRNGSMYILSIDDPQAIATQLRSDKAFYGLLTSLFASIGVALFGIIIYRWWRRKLAEYRQKKLSEMAKRARIERQRKAPLNQFTDDSMTCIVCLNQQREMILLPCGHICMCFDCTSQTADRPCPVCRQKVSSVHLIYFS